MLIKGESSALLSFKGVHSDRQAKCTHPCSSFRSSSSPLNIAAAMLGQRRHPMEVSRPSPPQSSPTAVRISFRYGAAAAWTGAALDVLSLSSNSLRAVRARATSPVPCCPVAMLACGLVGRWLICCSLRGVCANPIVWCRWDGERAWPA